MGCPPKYRGRCYHERRGRRCLRIRHHGGRPKGTLLPEKPLVQGPRREEDGLHPAGQGKARQESARNTADRRAVGGPQGHVRDGPVIFTHRTNTRCHRVLELPSDRPQVYGLPAAARQSILLRMRSPRSNNENLPWVRSGVAELGTLSPRTRPPGNARSKIPVRSLLQGPPFPQPMETDFQVGCNKMG